MPSLVRKFADWVMLPSAIDNAGPPNLNSSANPSAIFDRRHSPAPPSSPCRPVPPQRLHLRLRYCNDGRYGQNQKLIKPFCQQAAAPASTKSNNLTILAK